MKTKVTVSHEEFIRIWNGSESLDEVVKKTGLSRPTVSNRKTMLANIGVEFKLFPGMRLNEQEIGRLVTLSKETLAITA